MAAAKEPDFGQTMGVDPEYMDLKQKRAIAQALMQATMNAQGGSHRRHPLAVGLDFLSLKGSRDKLTELSAQEKALMQKQRAEEDAAMQELLAGLQPKTVELPGPTETGAPLTGQQPADPRQAIVKALASRHARVAGLGGKLYEERAKNYNTLTDKFNDRIDLQSAIDSAGSSNIEGLRPGQPPGDARLRVFDSGDGRPGVRALEVPQLGKPPSYQVVREPSNVSATATASRDALKPGWQVLEQQGKDFSEGGGKESVYTKFQEVNKHLANTQEILTTLSMDPQLGAGAGMFQTARKWATTFGIPESAIQGPTDLAKMQLGQKTLDRLGGLGAQVSDADRKFMIESQGSLDSDPHALRRLLLIEAKALMRLGVKLQDRAKQVAAHPTFQETGITFPNYTTRFQVPESFAPEFDHVMRDGMVRNEAPPALRAPHLGYNPLIPPALGAPRSGTSRRREVR